MLMKHNNLDINVLLCGCVEDHRALLQNYPLAHLRLWWENCSSSKGFWVFGILCLRKLWKLNPCVYLKVRFIFISKEITVYGHRAGKSMRRTYGINLLNEGAGSMSYSCSYFLQNDLSLLIHLPFCFALWGDFIIVFAIWHLQLYQRSIVILTEPFW